jgi:hypothetical protein
MFLLIHQLTKTLIFAVTLFCPSASHAQQPTATGKFAVDGLTLGGKVSTSSSIYGQYSCSASDQFRAFTYCKRIKVERQSGQSITTTTTLLHSVDGTAAYINQFTLPVFLKREQILAEIGRLSAMYRQGPRTLEIRRGPDNPQAMIATWGSLELTPLNDSDLEALRNDGSVTRGILIDYLGDYTRSANARLPVYAIRSGTGFVWAASYDEQGRGKLRFLAIDASQLSSAHLQAPPQSRPPKQRGEQSTQASDSIDQNTIDALKLLKLTIECSRPLDILETNDGPKQVQKTYSDSSDKNTLRFTGFTTGAGNDAQFRNTIFVRADWQDISSATIREKGAFLICSDKRKCFRIGSRTGNDYGPFIETDHLDMYSCSEDSAENMVVAIQTLIAHAKQ